MSFFQKIKSNKKIIYSIIGSVCAISLIVVISIPVALNNHNKSTSINRNQSFEVSDYQSDYMPYNNLFNFDILKDKGMSEINKSLIESTINSNHDTFSITILDHIVKNNDLNFITFYYKLSNKQEKEFNVNLKNKNSISERKDFVFSKTIYLNGNIYQKNSKEISWKDFDKIAIQNGSKTDGVRAFLNSNFGRSFVNSIFGLIYDVENSTNSQIGIKYKPDVSNNMLQSSFSMFELGKQILGQEMENSLKSNGIVYPYPSLEENNDPATMHLTHYVKEPIKVYSEYKQQTNNKNLIGILFGVTDNSSISKTYSLDIAKESANYRYFEMNNNKYFELFISNVELNSKNGKTSNLPINKKLYIDVTNWNLKGL